MGSSELDQQIAEVLVQLGGVLHNEQTVDRVLDLVTVLTERTVRTAGAVSVTLIGDNGDPFTSSASATVARDLDEVQYRSGVGPCLEAIRERRPTNVVLSQTDAPWPDFITAAKDSGIGSVLSLPLTVQERPLGGLNIYSGTDGAFEEDEETTAALLAQQAAAVLANAVVVASVSQLNAQLVEALATRDLIGQAKGILMAREHCDGNEAFDILRRASQRTNRKLRDIAAELVASTSDRTRPR